MKSKYVVLNKFGRVMGVSDSLHAIATRLGLPDTSLHRAYETGKPLRGQLLIMEQPKHEYLWHKYGGRRGGSDHFAFCTPEELRAYKETETREYRQICERVKPMRL